MNLIVLCWPGRMIKHATARLALFTVFICSMPLLLQATPSLAQTVLDRNISINISGKDLKSAIDAIAATAQVKILYSGNLVQVTKKINLHEKNQPLRVVLDKALYELPYSYEVMDGSVLIKYDEKKLQNQRLEKKRQNAPPVSGRVLDASGQPLVGATVKVKGRSIAVITDVNGVFALNGVTDDEILVVSFIGYKTREVKAGVVNAGTAVILEEDESALKEVTVSTGYQEVPLERATGSFAKVGSTLYNREVSTDVISRLKGIAPGLLFDERGTTTRLSIRGRSTIFANDQPLIVVDNFPYDGDINNINPNDVESVSILKDAAAASIWGVRAGNGVIVITTKKGKKNQAATVEMNANVTIGNRPDLFYQRQISPDDFINNEIFLFNNGYYNSKITSTKQPVLSPVVEILAKQKSGQITSADATAQINALRGHDVRTDMEKYLYRNSVNQQYNVNIKGGSEKYTYYFSAAHDNNILNATGNSYKRTALNSQQAFYPLKGLEITTGLVLTQSTTQNNSPLTSFKNAAGANYPYARLADENGNPLAVNRDYRAAIINGATAKGLLDWRYIPLDELKNSDNSAKTLDGRFNASVRYNFFSGFNIDIKYQYERQDINTAILQGAQSYYTRNMINSFSTLNPDGSVTKNVPDGAIFNTGSNVLNSNSGRAQLNYNGSWGDHQLSAIGGFEAREATVDGNQQIQYGYDVNTGQSVLVNYTAFFKQYPTNSFATIPGITSTTGTVDRFRSYFANAAYTYKNRYTLSGSGRIDQSNLFGVATNQKSVPLWSAGFKWAIDKEPFYNVALLPALALRMTYGYNGNYDNSVTAYTTAATTFNVLTQQSAAFVNTPPNADLRWEKSGILNIGIDFGSRSNRISGSVEYYHKKGVDLIGYGPVDPTTGFASFKGNVAASAGRGWDVLLNSRNLQGKFHWETAFMLSNTSDKITDYKLPPSSTSRVLQDPSINSNVFNYTPIVGKPLFAIFAYKWAGLDPQTGDPMGLLGGKPSKDYGTLVSVPVDSLVYKGSITPTIFGSLRNTFGFGPVSLSVNISYRFGYYFRRSSINYSSLATNQTGNIDYAYRWQHPGDEKTTNVPSLIYPNNTQRDQFYNFSEILVEKGDNIRLQDANLSYDFGSTQLKRLRLQHLSVFVYANNIGLLWTANKYHIDPDYPTLKLPRTIAFGLHSNF